MATLPRQTTNAAFRAETYASGTVALPNRRPVLPAPPAPTQARPIPVSRPRHTAQTGWLMGLVVLALLVVSAGMVYLSGHAQVTQEGYRHNKLVSMLKQAREKQQQARQMKALLYTPAHIEHNARAMGMIPIEQNQTVTVGETTPAQLLQQAVVLETVTTPK